MLSQADYDQLHDIVFRGDYPGYRPNVLEDARGNGEVDTEKRFAHVATKYLKDYQGTRKDWTFLAAIHMKAVAAAQSMAVALGVPTAFRPHYEFGALRILEYPPGAVAHEHTDFNLFTLMLYRDQPECFISDWHDMPAEVAAHNKQAHLGEIGEIIGLGKATNHSVAASTTTQRSIVYFAIPDHGALLPTGQTVGNWLTERMAKTRIYK